MSAFLAVVGWSLLAVFLLLLVLLLFPVSVPIELQQDQVVIKLKVLFLTFQLYPRREKQEAKTPGKESGQPAAESKQHTDCLLHTSRLLQGQGNREKGSVIGFPQKDMGKGNLPLCFLFSVVF